MNFQSINGRKGCIHLGVVFGKRNRNRSKIMDLLEIRDDALSIGPKNGLRCDIRKV